MQSTSSLLLFEGAKNSQSGASLNLKLSADSTTPLTSQHPLYLKINCNSAADLVPSNTNVGSGTSGEPKTKKKYSSSKSVNPILVAQLNDIKKSTSRKLDTNQPSWNDEVYIPLRAQDHSSVLVFSVWDKHTRYKNYLGEFRIDLREVFIKEDGKFVDRTDYKWYRLNSSTQIHSFVTGSILVSFELVFRNHTSRIKKFLSTSIIADKLSRVTIDHEGLEAAFRNWVDNLITVSGLSVKNGIKPNDQGFYDEAMVHGSDLESVLTDRSSAHNFLTIGDAIATNGNANGSSRSLLAVPHDDAGSFSEASVISADGGYASDTSNELFNKDAPVSLSPKKKGFRSKLVHRIKEDTDKFELASRQVLGVVFIEIVSCEDLPPYKNFTRTSFDMDPFVVVSFGKKTFRTGWKRHTLNPVFKERLAFEILPHENNFSIQFLILDKDHFSFHDDVAHISLPLRDITEYATVKPTEDNLELPDGADIVREKTPVSFTTRDDEAPSNASVRILCDEEEQTNGKSRKKFLKRKTPVVSVDPSQYRTMSLSLNLHDQKYIGKYSPKLKIRVRFETYTELRKQFWRILLKEYQNMEVNPDETYDYIELISLLDTVGCTNSDEVIEKFYTNLNKSTWGGDLLTYDEIIDQLELHLSESKDDDDTTKIFVFEKCPICNQNRVSKKQDLDIITHFAICASKDWNGVSKILLSSYVTPTQATKKWFTKALIKLTYGKYKLGGNSANILVQDRMTGIILEEKMSVYVRLGIRLLYKGLDKARSKRVRIVLRNMSIKQGKKFDSPLLKADIASFIKFHKLNLEECLIQDPEKYSTFNEFFYRKLQKGARLIEGESNDKIITSPADCRCVVFDSIDEATKLWIKGTGFTVQKLIHEDQQIHIPSYSLGIFRLAPQDYHRFHSPVDGVIENIKDIDGEYYTVNPMAIRSQLDVFGENVRSIVTIKTSDFERIYMIAVGAMMVGSIVFTVEAGSTITKGQEVGYFKFGGSTILLLIESSKFKFDSDLVKNSNAGLETLLQVGQSIGHAPGASEFVRDHVAFEALDKARQLRLIRVLTGSDLKDKHQLSNWEANSIVMEDFQPSDLFEDESMERIVE
ncbi:Phosphatidylserine decarboxylase proenzyme 2 [Candida viswanathii]|uniref:Phosphatidylserine decarboxylase proenzyme 2 n=1 Tax=Candida viswanathii TaxID=5486 RepID=A0A367YGL3_9ASCO|nr:Phosphatidylserine decarboxylase proenzyme 2 [Candida viswanathii]